MYDGILAPTSTKPTAIAIHARKRRSVLHPAYDAPAAPTRRRNSWTLKLVAVVLICFAQVFFYIYLDDASDLDIPAPAIIRISPASAASARPIDFAGKTASGATTRPVGATEERPVAVAVPAAPEAAGIMLPADRQATATEAVPAGAPDCSSVVSAVEAASRGCHQDARVIDLAGAETQAVAKPDVARMSAGSAWPSILHERQRKAAAIGFLLITASGPNLRFAR
jgi:hypothetical protein